MMAFLSHLFVAFICGGIYSVVSLLITLGIFRLKNKDDAPPKEYYNMQSYIFISNIIMMFLIFIYFDIKL